MRHISLKTGDIIEVDADNGIARIIKQTVDTHEDINEIVKQKKWQFASIRRMSYQKIRLFSRAYHDDIPKLFGVSLSSELYRVKDSTVSQCYDIEERKIAFADIERQFADKKSVKIFAHLAKLIRSFEDSFKVYIESMPTSYSTYDNALLLKAYQDYCEIEYKISLPNWVLFGPFEEIITKTLKQALTESLKSQDKAEKVIKDLSLPYKPVPLDFHNKMLYEIALAPKNKKEEMLSRMSKILAHWGVFDVSYPEPGKDSFAKKLAEIKKYNAKKLLAELEEKYKGLEKKTKAIIKRWEDNQYIHSLLTLYSYYANYKDWKNYYREQSSYKLKILLTEISKKIGLSLEETSFLIEEETAKALRGELRFSHEEMQTRIKDSAYLFLNNKFHIITDKGMLSEIDNIVKLPGTGELKGQGAYPGKIRGAVCLVISSKDFHKVKSGDILVTSTTRPDYIPAMKKAAGFVTDEGGLLSHAAIVARELKKPCVIGTKTATQVLKDGDLVEVDANKGTVKKL